MRVRGGVISDNGRDAIAGGGRCRGVRMRAAANDAESLQLVRRQTAAEDLVEGAPEVAHRACVDDRIHARVDVAEPREHWQQDVGALDARRVAQSVENVGDEERHPADAKHAHDDAQRLGRFLLFSDFADFTTNSKLLPLSVHHS